MTAKQPLPKMYFIEALQELININLNKNFVQNKKAFTLDTVKEILSEIRETVFETFFKMQLPLSDTSKRYVAQELFKCININGDQEFMENFAFNEIKPKDISTADLRILADLMHMADFEDAIKSELAKR